MARAYFNDVDEEFFRAGDEDLDQRAQRSYSDLQEYDGFAPGVFRRAVNRVAGARRVLVIAGVFLAGSIVGFVVARVSGEAPSADVAIPSVASPGAEPPAHAPPAAVQEAARPAPPPALAPTPVAPAPEPVVAKPAAATAVESAPKTAAKPTKRAASRRATRPRPARTTAGPVFPY